MSSKIDLTEWSLSEEDLVLQENIAQVRIHLAYPGHRPYLHLAPAERRQAISAHYRQDYRQLRSLLNGHTYQRIGSSVRPTGVVLQLPLNQLPALLGQSVVESVSVDAIEGLKARELAPEPSFWCLLARFAIQIEHETSGLQKYEMRHLLVRAFTLAEAEAKLVRSFARYEEPYLNSAGYLVRWHFEAFVDSYQLDVSAADTFLSEEGVEVFSSLHQRRLQPAMEWHPDTPSEDSKRY
ncbi:DUF4288 domain-containing protein [Hymenobacter metallicola]|uniref:DUF4288 domain-containing protein n=1 Tax=Hymenobacter metallicola TaxID=2563114 RepID=A0A4Z0PVW1_9BACT|nr:DUF4288 domain-containing protein [Hymenobacter metallicola]TGE20993.1 DUF4288 domain-containing protein [Hymenobacter metallicola]